MAVNLYYDTEADNLLPKVTTLHCIGAINIDTGEEFYWGPAVPAGHPCATPVTVTPAGSLEDGIRELQCADLAVAHNGLDYDRRMLKKLYPWYAGPKKERDSLIVAKLLWPYDTLLGPDLAGMRAGRFPSKYLKSHSLAAWGYRLGCLKDEYKGGFEKWTPEMAAYMMQDCRAGLTLWERCIKRLGWKNPEPGAYVWPELPVDIEHELAVLILQQSEDGVCFNKAKAVELSRQLTNAQASVGTELRDLFGCWWQYLDDPITGASFPTTMKRKLDGHPNVTVKRTGKRGQALTPYVGPPFEQRDEGSAYVRIEWTEFSPGSRDHLAKRLGDLYGWAPKEFGKDGKAKLDETVISEIPDHVVPKDVRTKVLQYFKLTKTLGMLSVGAKSWLRMASDDGRIHGTMDTCGAITSRAIHKNPNLSQVPAVAVDKDGVPIRGIEGGFGYECRELFEADHGWELTGLDITALELVTLGHFLWRFDNGAFSERVCDAERDPHTEHSALTGVPRAETKTCTYLYIYGGGAWKLTSEIDITEDEIPGYLGYRGLAGLLGGLRKRFGDTYREPDDRGKALLAKARTIILKFEAGITGIKLLVEDVKEAARSKGWLKGLDGRKLIVRPSKAHAALAPLNQGAGSIVCKLWIINAHKALRAAGLKPGVDYKQVLWSHDEIQITHRPGLGPQITKIVLGALAPTAETLKLRGTLRGTGKTGHNWAECH